MQVHDGTGAEEVHKFNKDLVTIHASARRVKPAQPFEPKHLTLTLLMEGRALPGDAGWCCLCFD